MRCPSRSALRSLAILVVGALLLGACEATPPRGPGAIQVQSTVTDPEFSFFNYGISIDDGAPFDLVSGVPRTFLVKGLAHGEHTVAVKQLPGQCSPGGSGATRTVHVRGDDTVGVVFAITCARTTGDLTVVVTTTGSDPDSDGYFLTMDGFLAAFLAPNASFTLQRLFPALYVVGLEDIAANCSYGGPQTANVTAGSAPVVSFTVTCAPLAYIKVVSSTTGPENDEDGYLMMAGRDTSLIRVSDTTVVSVPAGSVTYVIGDIQPNCAFVGPSSGEATLAAGDTLALALDATCTALPGGTTGVDHIDTVGDTLPNTGGPPAHDMKSVATRYAPDWLIVSMKFVHPPAPAGDELPNSIYGLLEFDADESTSTGSPAISNNFGASATVGVDYLLLMDFADGSSAILIDRRDFVVVGFVPMRFDGDSIRIHLPLEKLANDDGSVAMVMVYGTEDRPTDVAPNSGELVSHVPSGAVASATVRTSGPRMQLPITSELRAKLRLSSRWKPQR